MKCFECGGSGVEVSHERYHYTSCGLPNVWIENAEIRRCPDCGDESPAIPKMTALHRLIGHKIVRKRARLTGAEVRYLRKLVGWASKDLAKRMRVDKSVVSRWENGHDRIGMQSDILLRLLVLWEEPVRSYEDLDEITPDDEDAPPSELHLTLDHGDWAAASAA